MKSKDFSKALGEINDKYITEANEYQAKENKNKFNWKSLVACAAVIALIFGIAPFFNTGKNGDTTEVADNKQVIFGLTAYAIDNDHNVKSATMKEGQSIPVSLFNTENGLKGFVFSYDLTEAGEQTTSVSIMTDGIIDKPQVGAGQTESAISDDAKTEDTFSPYSYVLEEIAGLEMEKDKHYTYYVPQQTMTSQYRLMIPCDDIENNTVSEYHLLIEETKDGYVATIEKIVTHERKVIPPSYH